MLYNQRKDKYEITNLFANMLNQQIAYEQSQKFPPYTKVKLKDNVPTATIFRSLRTSYTYHEAQRYANLIALNRSGIIMGCMGTEYSIEFDNIHFLWTFPEGALESI